MLDRFHYRDASVAIRTPSRPGELSVEELMLLVEKTPQVYAHVMRGCERQRRLAGAGMITQIVGNLSELAALAICAAVAWHAFDRGAAIQGAAIICTGAVSIVTSFAAGRVSGIHGQAVPPSTTGGRPAAGCGLDVGEAARYHPAPPNRIPPGWDLPWTLPG